MPKNKVTPDPIPEQFAGIEEAGEFWDTPALTDYHDQTHEVQFEVDVKRRVFLTALEPGLAKKLGRCAQAQGISTETLINVWLNEKLAEANAAR